MKKILGIVVVLGLAVATYWQLTPARKARQEGISVSLPKKNNTDRIHFLYQAPRERLLVKESLPEISPPCVEFIEDLRGVDFTRVIGGEPDAKLPNPKTCPQKEALPDWIRAHHDRFLKACDGYETFTGEKSELASWQEKNSPCYLEGMVYRAALTEWATNETDLHSIKDSKVIVDKLVTEMNQLSPKIAATAERLLELEPESPYGIRSLAVGRYLEAARNAEKDPQNTHWDDVEKAIQKMEEISPENVDGNLQLSLLAEYMQHKDVDQLEAAVLEAQKKYGTAPTIEKYLAFVAYKRGHREAAREHLKRYASLSNDPDGIETLNRLEAGNETPFRMQLASTVELFRLQGQQ